MTAHLPAVTARTARALWPVVRGVDAVLAALFAPVPSSIAAHEEVG